MSCSDKYLSYVLFKYTHIYKWFLLYSWAGTSKPSEAHCQAISVLVLGYFGPGTFQNSWNLYVPRPHFIYVTICKSGKSVVSWVLSDLFTKFPYFDRILQWILYHSPSHESESYLWWASTWFTFPITLEFSWKIIR